jgi:hypothetical protein
MRLAEVFDPNFSVAIRRLHDHTAARQDGDVLGMAFVDRRIQALLLRHKRDLTDLVDDKTPAPPSISSAITSSAPIFTTCSEAGPGRPVRRFCDRSEDEGLFKDRLHLLGVCHETGGQVSAVELEALTTGGPVPLPFNRDRIRGRPSSRLRPPCANRGIVVRGVVATWAFATVVTCKPR